MALFRLLNGVASSLSYYVYHGSVYNCFVLQPPSGTSWLGSLISTIIGNLKISISNVHIRYEDSVRLVGAVFYNLVACLDPYDIHFNISAQKWSFVLFS